METLVTASAIAEKFQLNVQRVYEICRTQPDFPKIVIGRRQYRFSPSAVQRWIDQGGTKRGGDQHEE